MSLVSGGHDPLYALRAGEKISTVQQIRMVLRLSIPAILSQISSVVMQYIDAAMVGQIGAGGAAAVGIVASSTWLLEDLSTAVAAGFTVLAAQSIGAGEERRARELMKEALLLGLLFSLLIAALGMAVSGPLPRWLGGDEAIRKDAADYFFVFALFMPVLQLDYIASSMIQASGNMRVPSALGILKCALDVVFNYFLIFPGGELWGISLPGAGLGVLGAALGTALSRVVAGGITLYFLFFRSPALRLRAGEKLVLRGSDFRINFRIAIPMAAERVVNSGAHVLYTGIVAPLGTLPLAAHSLAITAESLCYMPGYGVSAASATAIGQSIGAERKDMTRRLGWLCMGVGVSVVCVSSCLMYIGAPWMMGLLSPEEPVVKLGAEMLRIVALVEPAYTIVQVSVGVFRGAGDTLVPSLLSFGSMWLLRLPLAAYLAPRLGLRGAWIAMSAELLIRGIAFLLRFIFHRWEDTMKQPAG